MLSCTSKRSHRHTILHVSFSNSFGLASARPTPQGLSGAPENRKLYFDKRKERIQAKMTFAEKIAHDKIFREKNPLYVKLEEEINELNQKVYNLQDKIRKRERVEERLTVCLKRTESIEAYKKEDHASK